MDQLIWRRSGGEATKSVQKGADMPISQVGGGTNFSWEINAAWKGRSANRGLGRILKHAMLYYDLEILPLYS